MKKSEKCVETINKWKNDYHGLDIENTEECEQYFNALKETYLSYEKNTPEEEALFQTMLRILAQYIYEAEYVPEKVSFMMAANVMKTLSKETEIPQVIEQQMELFTGYIIAIQYDTDDDVTRFVYHHENETDAIHEYVHELYDGKPENKAFEAEDDFPSDEHKMA